MASSSEPSNDESRAEKAGLHKKKKSYSYKERKEELRVLYSEKVSQLDPSSLVYWDESGIDSNDDYPYGWSRKGRRCYGRKSGKKKKRISMIAALHGKQLKAAFTFEGHGTQKVFDSYVKEVLVPKLELGQTVILDNSSIHKSARTRELIESAGCHVLFLPPYSPDLNPIEHQWFVIKNAVRKQLSHGENLDRALFNTLQKMSE